MKITQREFDEAAEAFYETPRDPELNDQGNRRQALINALAAIDIRVASE